MLKKRLAQAIEALFAPLPNPSSAAELWVTGKGEVIPIGDMSRAHLVHSLAMVMRKAAEGNVWSRHTPLSRLTFLPGPQLMAEQVMSDLHAVLSLDGDELEG